RSRPRSGIRPGPRRRAPATAARSRRAPTGTRTWGRSSAASSASPPAGGSRRERAPAAGDRVLLSAARGRRGAPRAELHPPPAGARLALHRGVRRGAGLLGDRSHALGRDPARHRGAARARRQRPRGLAAPAARTGRRALGAHLLAAAPRQRLVAAARFLRRLGAARARRGGAAAGAG